MSEIIQWIIVSIVVVLSAIYLVKRIRPSRNGSSCAGCPYSGSCTSKKSGCAR